MSTKQTKTVWVEMIFTQSVSVAIQVPVEMGNISAMDEAEKKASEIPPSQRFVGRPVKSKWEFYANRPQS